MREMHEIEIKSPLSKKSIQKNDRIESKKNSMLHNCEIDSQKINKVNEELCMQQMML